MDLFSARLKWSRGLRAHTQGEVAEAIGMSQPGYGKLENGQREPNLETLTKISNFLGESSDFLLGITDFSKKAKLDYRRFQELYRQYIHYQEQLTKEMENVDIVPSLSEIRIGYLRDQIFDFHYSMMKRHEKVIKTLEEIPFVKEETIERVKRYETISP